MIIKTRFSYLMCKKKNETKSTSHAEIQLQFIFTFYKIKAHQHIDYSHKLNVLLLLN